jgi:hypothetical protein
MAVSTAAKAHLEKLASQPKVEPKPKKATKKVETEECQDTKQADK